MPVRRTRTRRLLGIAGRQALGVVRTLRLDAAHVTRGAVLVVSPRAETELEKFSPGAVLVTQPSAARRGWMEREKTMSRYLAREHIAGVLAMYRVNCVIDAGAHRGQYGRALRKAGYRGYIVSFEPVPDVFAKLQATAADDPKWTAHEHALGRDDSVTSMNVMPGTFSSLLAPTKFGSRRYAPLREPKKQDVEVRRLDGILDSVIAHVPDPRLYLKLDTQGYDLEVFAGVGDRTGEFVGMQSEVSLLPIYEGMPRMCEALEAYEAAGFEITGLYPISRQARTGRVLEFDCVMVRAGSLKAAARGGRGAAARGS